LCLPAACLPPDWLQPVCLPLASLLHACLLDTCLPPYFCLSACQLPATCLPACLLPACLMLVILSYQTMLQDHCHYHYSGHKIVLGVYLTKYRWFLTL